MNLRLIGMETTKRKLTSIPRQTRFATSRAINDCAKEVQQHTLSQTLPDALTLRGNWQTPGNRFGINIKFANKDKLSATVGSRADWLKLQEEGGDKKAGEHRVAVPTDEHKPKQERMTREKKPRALLADIGRLEGERKQILATKKATHKYDKKQLIRVNRDLRSARTALKAQGTGSKAFIITTKTGFTGIFKRVERKLVLLFSLVRRAKVNPVLKFKEISARLVTERYDEIFTKRLREALK